MVTLKNPDMPATKSQLWLLHILTKTDTRNLTLTMKQASDKINELKSGKSKTDRPLINPHASAIQQDKHKIAQLKFDNSNKVMLGNIEITKAYKQISSHNWQGKTGFTIDTHLYGILPKGHKAHDLTWYNYDTTTSSFKPLNGVTRHFVDVPTIEVKNFIRNITDIRYYTPMPIPDDVKPIAEAVAKELEDSITIYHLIDGKYIRD